MTGATEETTRTRSAKRDRANGRGRKKRSKCSESKSRTGAEATRRRRQSRKTTEEEKEHTSMAMLRAALGIEEEKAAGGDGSALREGQLTSSTLSTPRGRHFVSRRGTDFENKMLRN